MLKRASACLHEPLLQRFRENRRAAFCRGGSFRVLNPIFPATQDNKLKGGDVGGDGVVYSEWNERVGRKEVGVGS